MTKPKPARAAAPSKQNAPKPKAAPKATLPQSIINALPSAAIYMRHLSAAAALTPDMAKELARAKKGGSIALARSFVALHRLMSRTDELLKPAGDLLNEYKAEILPQVFEQDGVTNIPLDEGYRVGLSSRFVASIKPGEKEPAYDWLKANGLEDIIQPTVNSGTLSAALKNMLEEKNKEPPAELLNTAFLPNVSVTTTK